MSNKRRPKAAALRYEPHIQAAPEVVAAGVGVTAEAILALAEEHNVPLFRDPQLVEQLLKIEINREIPEELYEAAARVLAFVYQLDRRSADTREEYGDGKR